MSIYFARVGDYLKIGMAANPTKRVQRIRTDDGGKPLDLDTARPVELLKVVPGDRDEEEAAHSAVADYHVVCEWFAAEPPLIAWIESLTGQTFPTLPREGGRFVHTLDAAGQARADAYIEKLLDRGRRRRAREVRGSVA